MQLTARARCAAACLLVLAAATAGAAAEQPIAAEVLARIQALDARIQHRIELARLNHERGRLKRPVIDDEVLLFTADVEALEAALRGLPDAERGELAPKVRALAMEVWNLRLAADGVFSPIPVKVPGRAYHIGFTESLAPINDDCADATPVTLGGVYIGDTSSATNDGQASCGASLFSADVWFRYFAGSTGWVAVDTLGSSFDTVLSVHEECPGTIANEMECNDDIQGLQSGVSFYAYAGHGYVIRVAGMDGATGAYRLAISTPAMISGEVTVAGSGQLVNGIVQVWSASGLNLGAADIDSGQYTVGWLPSGTYFLSTSAGVPPILLIDELWDDIPCPGGAPYGCDPLGGDPIAVVAGGHVTGIDFTLDVPGGIRGTVTQAAGGEPVSTATVIAWDSAGSFVESDWTNSLGEYEIRLSVPGTYFATVTGSGFDDVLYDGIPCPGGPSYGCDPTSGSPVPVEPNAVTGGVDFAVDTGGRIEGVVRDPSGNPIAWATVRVYTAGGSYAGYAYTTGDGRYAAVGLDDGSYFLTAGEWGYATVLYDAIPCRECDVTSGTPVAVVGGSSAGTIDFELPELGSISGTILESPSGSGYSSVQIEIFDSSGAAVDWLYTYPGSSYVATDLWQAVHFVVAGGDHHVDELYDDLQCEPDCDPLAGTPVPVVFGQPTSGIDFTLVRKGTISGVVIDQATGEPAYVSVGVYDSTGVLVAADGAGAGGYSLSGLDDGTYFVAIGPGSTFREELFDDIVCWGGPPVGCDAITGTPVSASAGTITTGIDFSLLRRGEIRGTIHDVLGGEPGWGEVRIIDATGFEAATVYWNSYSPSYTAGGLAPGSYFVVADSSESHRDEVWHDLPCDGEYPQHCSHASGVTVQVSEAGVVTGIDFTLDRLGTIQGTVVDGPSGTPIYGVTVRLYDEGGGSIGDNYSSSSGAWEWSGAWPGSYFAVTDEHSLEHVDQLYDGIPCPGGPGDGCTPTSGTPIALDYNTVASGIDFQLGQYGSIAGRITGDPSGVPLPGIGVIAWDGSSTIVATSGADSTGTYRLRGLLSGTYFVSTEHGYWDGVLDELYDDIPCPHGPPGGCDPTKGTPVVVVEGAATRFIDFALQPWGTEGVAGLVTDLQSGAPIEGVAIDFWDSSGVWSGAAMTGPAGEYVAALVPATYRVSTDNPLGYLNEIFDDLPCPGGSAYSGACDPLVGDAVVVPNGGIVGSIDFALSGPLFVFSDGFESGDIAAWSSAVP